MKRASVCFDQSRATDVDAVEKLKYQSLLKEYLELQKEYVSRKRKLQAAKQKRKLSLAEVRFLKRKHAYLLKSKSPSSDKDLLHLPNTLQGGRNLSSGDQILLSLIYFVKDRIISGCCHLAMRGVNSVVLYCIAERWRRECPAYQKYKESPGSR